jgi:hypothetical protein
MVPLLPLPVDDEHLLSLVHGYVRLNGLEAQKFFGYRNRLIFVNQGFNYHYQRAAALFANVMSEANFLDHFGFARLYKRYLRSDIYWSRLTGHSLAKRTLGQTTHSGRALVHDAMHFWFCPRCRVNDIAMAGYARWRRSHQIRGVQVCPTHGCSLIKQCSSCGYCPGDLSALESDQSECKQCGAKYLDVLAVDFRAERSLLLARFIEALLADSLPEHNVDLFVERLEAKAMARYGVSESGVPARVRQEIESTFTANVLNQLHLNPRMEQSAGWIRWFFAKLDYTKNFRAQALVGSVVFHSFDEWVDAFVDVSTMHFVVRPTERCYSIPLTSQLLKDLAWQSDLASIGYSENKLQWVIVRIPGLQRVRSTRLIYAKQRLLELKKSILNNLLKPEGRSPRPVERVLYEAERRTMGRGRRILEETVATIAYRWHVLYGDEYPMPEEYRVRLYGEKAQEVIA